MTMVITKVVGASGVTVVPGVPYPQMTESQQSWFLILKVGLYFSQIVDNVFIDKVTPGL